MDEKEKILKQFIVWLYDEFGTKLEGILDPMTKQEAVQLVDEYIEETHRDIKYNKE